MKRIHTIIAVTAAASMFFATTAFAVERPGKRQVRQQTRIHQGVKSGEVTKKEYRHLERQQTRIQRSKRQAWSDGQLTAKERVRLERQQDKASRHIYRAKHNDADRN